MNRQEHPLDVLRRLDWWLVIVAMGLVFVGLVFVQSATRYDPQFAGQHLKQALFVAVSVGMGGVVILIPYPRIMRWSWVLFAGVVLALTLLPIFGTTINGARRWFMLPGFAIQPSEFAKLAVVLALASWLRLRSEGRWVDNLLIPALITAVPAALVMRQPDLGSSLVFWPTMLAMVYAAGATARQIAAFVGCGLVLAVLAYGFVLHDYQQTRIDAWRGHFAWNPEVLAQSVSDETVEQRQARLGELREIQQMIRDSAWQPWQSVIAIGSGGWSGFGVGQGPQNRYDFLPYRNADYIFAVVAEERGLLGALGLMGLQALLMLGLLKIAVRSRERYGRLVVVGVMACLGSQSLMHIAVCAWLVPATGLPLPFMSYGGSSTMVAVLALAMALNVSAHRQPVVAADGFR